MHKNRTFNFIVETKKNPNSHQQRKTKQKQFFKMEIIWESKNERKRSKNR